MLEKTARYEYGSLPSHEYLTNLKETVKNKHSSSLFSPTVIDRENKILNIGNRTTIPNIRDKVRGKLIGYRIKYWNQDLNEIIESQYLLSRSKCYKTFFFVADAPAI
jgi:hypothetical protein